MTDQDLKFEVDQAIREGERMGFSQDISVDWLLREQLGGPVTAEQMKILEDAVLKFRPRPYVHLSHSGKALCGATSGRMVEIVPPDFGTGHTEEHCPKCLRIVAGNGNS